MPGDDVEPWLKKIYDAQYEAWARKVDAADPGYKKAADRIERYFEESAMSEMLERMQEAMWQELWRQDENLPAGSDSSDLDMHKIARAAIEAMREPTVKMCAAGDELHRGVDDPEDTPRLWRAMVDAALKEGDV